MCCDLCSVMRCLYCWEQPAGATEGEVTPLTNCLVGRVPNSPRPSPVQVRHIFTSSCTRKLTRTKEAINKSPSFGVNLFLCVHVWVCVCAYYRYDILIISGSGSAPVFITNKRNVTYRGVIVGVNHAPLSVTVCNSSICFQCT